MAKTKLTLWIDEKLALKLRTASLEETGTLKGVSSCVTDAIEDWLKKKGYK